MKNILICGVFLLLLILVSLGVISWVKYFAPISRLKDEDPEVRRRAVENLAESWVPDRVTRLTVALKDADFEVRDAAARALGNIGPDAEAAVESLIHLQERDSRVQKGEPVKLSASVALGKIGEPAMEPLINALQDEDVRMRSAAAMGMQFVLPAVKDPQIRARAVEPLILAMKDADVYWSAVVLGPFDEPALELRMLTGMIDADARRYASALSQIGEPALEPLINALQDEDVHVRRAAAAAIPGVVPAVKDPETRAIVVRSLMRAMKDKDVALYQCATGALFEIAEAGLEPLISVLEDEDTPEPHVGPAVEDPESRRTTVERLIRIMAHREEIRGEVLPPVLSIARRGLIRMAHRPVVVKGFGPLILHKIGEPALEPLINALQDEDVRMRRVAAMAMQVVLPNVKDPRIRARAVEPLIRAMKDADRKVHRYALSALSQIGEPALESLINALQDEDVRMRSGAATAMQIVLPAVKDPQIRARAIEPLIHAMKDADSQVRGLAAVALAFGMGYSERSKIVQGGVAVRALELLINLLQDEDVRMRRAAAMAMQIVLPAVEDLQTRARAVEPLIRAMKDADSQVRDYASVALSKIATEKAKNALRDAGFDKYLKGDK